MQTDTSGVASNASGLDGSNAAQELEEWAEKITLMVAGTLEPSCAWALCFGTRFVIKRRAPDESPIA